MEFLDTVSKKGTVKNGIVTNLPKSAFEEPKKKKLVEKETPNRESRVKGDMKTLIYKLEGIASKKPIPKTTKRQENLEEKEKDEVEKLQTKMRDIPKKKDIPSPKYCDKTVIEEEDDQIEDEEEVEEEYEMGQRGRRLLSKIPK
jgi:hypothetical protein